MSGLGAPQNRGQTPISAPRNRGQTPISVISMLVRVASAALVAAHTLGPAAAQPAGDPNGKPVAPFSVEADVLGPVAAGVPVDVRITVSSQVPLDDIEVRLSPDPGLSIDAGDLTLHRASASPGQPAEWQITVVPVAEGAHRLRLFGAAVVGGAPQARSTIATIRVGTGAAAERDSTTRAADRRPDAATRKPRADENSAASPAEADDERVIRLPAIVRP